MASKYSLQNIAQLNNRSVFFDANILIYLFWPTGQHGSEKKYATVFKKLLEQENVLFINFLVISEVVNSTIRTEYKKHLLAHSLTSNELTFKVYRNSSAGQETINDIYLIVRNDILKQFNLKEKSFNKQDIENFLMVDNLDFTDKAIASICAENNYVLLTHDKDFKKSGLEILTENPRILN